MSATPRDEKPSAPGANPTDPAAARAGAGSPRASAQSGAAGISLAKSLLVCAALALFLAATTARMQTADKEPIATVGHGGFFDANGKQIEVTQEFVARAQEWYRKRLLSGMVANKRGAFTTFQKRLSTDIKRTGFKAEGQALLVLKQRELDWLVANSEAARRDPRMVGKLNALKDALRRKLPERSGQRDFKRGEKFILAPQVEEKLKSPELNPGNVQLFSITTNSGQAYIDECRAAGVPIPPPIGQLDPAGTSGWKSQGFIPKDKQFIVGTPAEVRTFRSTSPDGMCIALPRYADDALTTVDLDGVICLGRATSKVCFWDNQMNGVGFSFPSGTLVPIGVPDPAVNPDGLYQAGGTEIERGTGGVCTDCHAGQNPYIIHPDVDLGGGAGPLMGDLKSPPQSLPTFGAARYDPLVGASWPQNQLSHSPDLVPRDCSGCHSARGSGGALPHLSSDLGDYCGTILRGAIGVRPLQPVDSPIQNAPPTMPLGAPGSLRCTPNLPPSDPRHAPCDGTQTASCSELAPTDPEYVACTPAMSALLSWCGTAPSAGPSDRGDPHLETADGVHYDFQSAGEFVALRSGNSMEIQTRQTAISTSFFPGPDDHTDLATCVSVNTAVAARVGTHRVTYEPNLSGVPDPGGMQLRVDGTLRALDAGGIDLGGGGRVRRTAAPGGIEVTFPDGTLMYVTPGWWDEQQKWYLDLDIPRTPAVKGILGRIAPGSWLPALPNGASLGPKPGAAGQRYTDLYKSFADAWRVTSANSLFDYAPGTNTDTFTLRSWPPQSGPCIVPETPVANPVELSVAEEACRQVVGKNRRADCVFDVRVTGHVGFARTYLAAQQVTGPEVDAGVVVFSDGQNFAGGGAGVGGAGVGSSPGGSSSGGGSTPGGRLALFLDAGAGIPHGTFSNFFDPGFSFNGGLEYIAAPQFSLEGVFGYHRFPGEFGGRTNLFHLSGNAKTYLTPPPNKVRPFFNGGLGAYVFDSGSTHFGGNVGGGLLYEATPRFGLRGAYNFHAVNTPGFTVRFSTVQGGVRFRF